MTFELCMWRYFVNCTIIEPYRLIPEGNYPKSLLHLAAKGRSQIGNLQEAVGAVHHGAGVDTCTSRCFEFTVENQ